ncbi:MAG: hypothetical protein ACRC6H_01305 [Culicoidibacterales bacterium]
MSQNKIEQYNNLIEEYTKIAQEIKRNLKFLKLQYESYLQVDDQIEAQQISDEIENGKILLQRVGENRRDLEFRKIELQQKRGWLYERFRTET